MPLRVPFGRNSITREVATKAALQAVTASMMSLIWQSTTTKPTLSRQVLSQQVFGHLPSLNETLRYVLYTFILVVHMSRSMFYILCIYMHINSRGGGPAPINAPELEVQAGEVSRLTVQAVEYDLKLKEKTNELQASEVARLTTLAQEYHDEQQLKGKTTEIKFYEEKGCNDSLEALGKEKKTLDIKRKTERFLLLCFTLDVEHFLLLLQGVIAILATFLLVKLNLGDLVSELLLYLFNQRREMRYLAGLYLKLAGLLFEPLLICISLRSEMRYLADLYLELAGLLFELLLICISLRSETRYLAGLHLDLAGLLFELLLICPSQ